jgi:hypothetical protein
MPFQPGNTEAKKATKERPFAAMLKVAINEAAAEGGTKLRQVAEALVNEAAKGNVAAIKELADRVDGKVPQGIEGTEDGPTIKTFSEVVHRIIRANAGN